MIYDELVADLATYLGVPLDDEDENFIRVLPRIIEYAENRIFREVTFLPTLTAGTDVLTANVREHQIPDTVLVLRQLVIFTPVGVVTPISVRHIPERVSPEFLDAWWPQDSSLPGVPDKYAIIGFQGTAVSPPREVLEQRLRLAPLPDAGYTIEYLGTIRPLPISAKNSVTYLSTVYPDLLFAGCMLGGIAYQRDFGAQIDDPAKAVTWESTYQTLKTGAALEAAKQSGEGPGWQPQPPAPLANAPRAP